MESSIIPKQLANWLNSKYSNKLLGDAPEIQVDINQLTDLLSGNPYYDVDFYQLNLDLFNDIISEWEKIIPISWSNAIILAKLLEKHNPEISIGALTPDALRKKSICLPNFIGTDSPHPDDLETIINVWMFLVEEI